MVEKRLYSFHEAAHSLGLSIHTLRAHFRQGNLNVVRVGKRVLFNTAELDRLATEGLPCLTGRAYVDIQAA